MRRRDLSVFFLLVAFGVTLAWSSGCDSGFANDNRAAAVGTFKIVATTGQINSALKKLTQGTKASVKLLCGPGVDPHSFSASTRDVQSMLDADLIVFNGFHLEAQLSEYLRGKFADKAWAMASAFPEADRLDWKEDGTVDPDAPFDPHIWNHLPGWTRCVDALAEKLADADPKHAGTYRENAKNYVDEINQAHVWAKEKLAEIPAENRTLVSAHDAFNYFAKLYDMKTLAVLGIGNDPEADIQTMRTVAQTIVEKRIPAIFLESITNPKVTEALQEACKARGWKVTLVKQQLYSDDIGETPPQDTFLGAFRSNVEIICDSLR